MEETLTFIYFCLHCRKRSKHKREIRNDEDYYYTTLPKIVELVSFSFSILVQEMANKRRLVQGFHQLPLRSYLFTVYCLHDKDSLMNLDPDATSVFSEMNCLLCCSYFLESTSSLFDVSFFKGPKNRVVKSQ